MAFDFKKEYKEYYMPKNKPAIVDVPKANYIAVRGKGNPNEEGGEYQQAISVLYAVAYTLRMSYKTDYKINGFFEYVVPPLEGFWWQEGTDSVDYSNKSTFNWISVIRLPDFITKQDFDWAVATAADKKGFDCSSGEDSGPLCLWDEPAGHRGADQGTVRCGDISGACNQDHREDHAGGYCLAESTAGKGLSLHLHGRHPLQGEGGPSVCDQGGIRGFGYHHGRTKRHPWRVDWGA